MEVDVKPEIPTPPASDVGSPQSSGPYSQHSSDSEPDSPMGEDSKVAFLSQLSNKFETIARGLKPGGGAVGLIHFSLSL